MRLPRAARAAALWAAALAAAALLLRRECESGGAMGGAHRTCACLGWERLDYDRTPADGPRRSVCWGWVHSRSCFRDRGGAEIPCGVRADGPGGRGRSSP